MEKCNVRIADQHFHEIHHALGCPWPDQVEGETYRNYFATDPNGETARRMKASPHWTGGRERFGHAYFSVTDEGRKALREHMAQNVELPARYAVTYHDCEGESIVTAKSRSAARYAAYLNADCGWSFMEFCAVIKSIRLHSRANIPTSNKPRRPI